MHDDKPIVSLIAPIYKVEQFVDKMILSLTGQTYKNIEILLVDDGSPDTCGAICDRHASCDSRITVIHKANGGVSSARNAGIEKATGAYIMFIDGDDWLESDCVAYFVSLIQHTGSDMAFSDKNFTTRNRVQTVNDRFEVITGEEAACRFLYPGVSIGCWNKIYRADFIKRNNLRFPDTISGEGMQFIVNAAQRTKCVGLGHRKVYNYRLNNAASAVTSHNLQIGLKAQDSINAIKRDLLIKTPRLTNAVNWHIWKNYGYVLFLIIATDSLKENRALYKNCRKNLLVKLPSVLLKSEVGLKTKIAMTVEAVFPAWWARRRLLRERIALKNDTAE